MRGITLDNLFTAALTGLPYNQLRLSREAKRYARRITNRAGADFPEERHEEVCHEAFVSLWMRGAGVLTSGSAQKTFRKVVIAAVGTVRRNYAAPGVRTRPPSRKKPPAAPRVVAEDIGVILDADALTNATVVEGERNQIDVNRLPSTSATADLTTINIRHDLDRILATAPAPVATALRLIHFDDIAFTETAKAVALSSFQLRRRIDAFQAIWAAAA